MKLLLSDQSLLEKYVNEKREKLFEINDDRAVIPETSDNRISPSHSNTSELMRACAS